MQAYITKSLPGKKGNVKNKAKCRDMGHGVLLLPSKRSYPSFEEILSAVILQDIFYRALYSLPWQQQRASDYRDYIYLQNLHVP